MYSFQVQSSDKLGFYSMKSHGPNDTEVILLMRNPKVAKGNCRGESSIQPQFF